MLDSETECTKIEDMPMNALYAMRCKRWISRMSHLTFKESR